MAISAPPWQTWSSSTRQTALAVTAGRMVSEEKPGIIRVTGSRIVVGNDNDHDHPSVFGDASLSGDRGEGHQITGYEAGDP